MPSTSERTLTLSAEREDYRVAWLAALAISIHLLESALPSPVPGIKPGLANVIVVVALVSFGWRTALWVSLLRVLVGSLLIGTFLSPTFLLSLAGALGSLLALGLGLWLGRVLPPLALGALGYSVLAALAHMTGQFLLAWTLFIPHPGLLKLLPLLLSAALVFGVVSGLVATAMVSRLGSR